MTRPVAPRGPMGDGWNAMVHWDASTSLSKTSSKQVAIKFKKRLDWAVAAMGKDDFSEFGGVLNMNGRSHFVWQCQEKYQLCYENHSELELKNRWFC